MHEYFDRKSFEWTIYGFLGRVRRGNNSFHYLASLENIAKTENGKKRDQSEVVTNL